MELDDDALDIIDDDELDDQANVNSEPEDDDLDFDEDDMDADDADGPGIIQDDLGDGDELIPSLDEKEEWHSFVGAGFAEKLPSDTKKLLA